MLKGEVIDPVLLGSNYFQFRGVSYFVMSNKSSRSARRREHSLIFSNGSSNMRWISESSFVQAGILLLCQVAGALTIPPQSQRD